MDTMTHPQYRIEREQALQGSLLPPDSFDELYVDRSLAVAMAIKSVQDPSREQVSVVHIATGEVVFTTIIDGPEPP